MTREWTAILGTRFYCSRIEDHVPNDRLLRAVVRFVDESGVRDHLKPFYSAMGRPSIDRELMIRMLIVVTAWASARSGERFSTSPIAGSAVSIRWGGARSLDLFQEPARSVPRR